MLRIRCIVSGNEGSGMSLPVVIMGKGGGLPGLEAVLGLGLHQLYVATKSAALPYSFEKSRGVVPEIVFRDGEEEGCVTASVHHVAHVVLPFVHGRDVPRYPIPPPLLHRDHRLSTRSHNAHRRDQSAGAVQDDFVVQTRWCGDGRQVRDLPIDRTAVRRHSASMLLDDLRRCVPDTRRVRDVRRLRGNPRVGDTQIRPADRDVCANRHYILSGGTRRGQHQVSPFDDARDRGGEGRVALAEHVLQEVGDGSAGVRGVRPVVRGAHLPGSSVPAVASAGSQHPLVAERLHVRRDNGYVYDEDKCRGH
eukprot:Hpha_TRINITY_DN13320_c0_g1::TRINITY_DN13320_c0_g1_i1::g.95307::m.95307